jgi:hypothetical protein
VVRQCFGWCILNRLPLLAISPIVQPVAQRYGLDDRGSKVRFLPRAGKFSLHHRVQKGSGAHPASSPMGTRGSLSGGKAAVA